MSTSVTVESSNQLVELSVVICTYNRAEVLSDTLRSYSKMRLADDPCIELLVVDNNSSDRTKQVVDEFKERLPRLRYVFEPVAGLSYARNTGILEAKGALVGYVDDDVWFDPGWLEAVLDIFRQFPNASCMGGCSIPHFEGGRPDWLTDNLLGFYGSTLSGDKIKYMIYPEYPYGLNMAFKREVFNTVGPFNPALGRKKKNLLSMEETEYFFRVAQNNLKVIYTPHALLYHRIPPERTRRDWILSRHYWQGVSKVAFQQEHYPVARPRLIGQAVKTALAIMKRSSGGSLSPRAIYWHRAKRTFRRDLEQAEDKGCLRRLLDEAFLP